MSRFNRLVVQPLARLCAPEKLLPVIFVYIYLNP